MKKQMKIMSLTLVFLLFSSMAFSETNLGLFGIGGKIGYIAPEKDASSTVAIGGTIDFGFILSHLGFELDAVYWSKLYSIPGVGTDVSSFSLSLMTRYYFQLKNFHPFIGTGIGLNKASVTVKYVIPFPDNTTSESKTDMILHAVGGFHMPLIANLDAIVEIRGSIASNYNYLGFFGGIIFNFK